MSNGNWRERRSSRPISDYLQAGSGTNNQAAGGLGTLLARAQLLSRLDAVLAELLDPALAPHVRVANVRDHKLVLVTPVAPIATRIRLLAPELLQQFQARDIKLFSSIETTVAPLPAHLMRREP
jgi:hypothetical protein